MASRRLARAWPSRSSRARFQSRRQASSKASASPRRPGSCRPVEACTSISGSAASAP
jgi:hypothetical protein